jgi:hypothetical protein
LGRGLVHPLPSSAEVKERVPISGPSWPILGYKTSEVGFRHFVGPGPNIKP